MLGRTEDALGTYNWRGIFSISHALPRRVEPELLLGAFGRRYLVEDTYH